MEPTPELIKQLYQDKLNQARRMSFEAKYLGGPRLFDFACEVAKAGIRNQFPDVDEIEVRRILRERLGLARRLQSGGS